MSIAFATATLNDGTTAISANGHGTGVALGTGTGAAAQPAAEALVRCICTVVTASGSFTISVRGGATAAAAAAASTDLVSLGTIAATGVTEARVTNLPPYLTWFAASKSGTSINAVIEVVGVNPHDSAIADPV